MILLVIFVAGSTYLVIVLLNMLIAIMQNTFTKRRGVAEQVKIKDHLKFVLDNWHLMDYALPNKSSMKYVIACLIQNEQVSSDKQIAGVKRELREIDRQN